MTGDKFEPVKKPRGGRPARSQTVEAVAPAMVSMPEPVAETNGETPAEILVEPVAETPVHRPSPILTSIPTSPLYEDNVMATAFENTTEAAKSTVNQFNESAESAMSNGKAAMEQVTAQAKEAAEASMKSIEEMSETARGNVEALLASARAAAAGFETLAQHIGEVSRKSFESTTTAARAMTSAKTPNELFQLQSDFAKTQFDAAVSEFSKMTEMMVKLSGEVMEPVQNRVAITTDKMKSAFTK